MYSCVAHIVNKLLCAWIEFPGLPHFFFFFRGPIRFQTVKQMAIHPDSDCHCALYMISCNMSCGCFCVCSTYISIHVTEIQIYVWLSSRRGNVRRSDWAAVIYNTAKFIWFVFHHQWINRTYADHVEYYPETPTTKSDIIYSSSSKAGQIAAPKNNQPMGMKFGR